MTTMSRLARSAISRLSVARRVHAIPCELREGDLDREPAAGFGLSADGGTVRGRDGADD